MYVVFSLSCEEFLGGNKHQPSQDSAADEVFIILNEVPAGADVTSEDAHNEAKQSNEVSL